MLVGQTNRRDLLEHRSPPDRDIAHLFGRDATSPESSVSAAVRWDIRKLVAQSRIRCYRSSHRAGTCSQMIHNSGTSIPQRETYAIQWFIGWTNTIRREYRSDCGQNSGGSVAMESSGPRIKFQSGYRRGGSILRGGNDSSSLLFSPLRSHSTGHRLILMRFLLTFVTYWIRHLGILTLHNIVVSRMFYCIILICFLPRGRLSPVILMPWSTKLTLVIVRPYAVRLVGCPLRR